MTRTDEIGYTRACVCKVDPLRRIVLGWAYRSARADGSPIVDASGEHIPYSELESMPPPWSNGPDTSGLMHETPGLAHIVGWLPIDGVDREALGFGPGDSGVVVKLRIVDDELWKRILAGELPALSIEGSALKGPA